MKLVLLCMPLLLSACGKAEMASYHKFPAAQSQIEEFVSGENSYWNLAEIVYQDENRQAIQFSHNQKIRCVVNLQSLDQSLVSGMGVVFWSQDAEMNPEERLRYKEAQNEIQDMIGLFYDSNQNSEVFSEWEAFRTYWEQPAECEGNRIQWNGSNERDHFQIKICRSAMDDSWLMESISLSTAELKTVHDQEMREVIASYPNYREYDSILEMKQDLSHQDEESYGSVKGKIRELTYDMALPYPDFLDSYPEILSSQSGYAWGELEDGTERLEVWCSPDVDASEEERELQFHYLPGTIPVIYVTS